MFFKQAEHPPKKKICYVSDTKSTLICNINHTGQESLESLSRSTSEFP